MPNLEEEKKKGTFTKLRLSISKKYIYPVSRTRMMVFGLLGSVAVGGYFGLDSLLLKDSFISSGPLSSNHANLEGDCNACHTPFSGVASENCSKCHEKLTSQSAAFSFAAHYRYGAKNEERVATAQVELAHEEMACYSCHPEHLGRTAEPVKAADSRCTGCHDFGSFNEQHPEFAFARESRPDDANLIFTHINHVMGYIGGDDPNKACTSCHRLGSDGTSFQALSFDRHCSDCHLTRRQDPQHEDLRALRFRGNECAWCHLVSRGNVAAVQTDQRVFTVAQFDHTPHVLLQNCLDCHTEIPMGKTMQGNAEADQSITQNIPKIDNCQTCHQPGLTSNTCITCHSFHPGNRLN